MGHPGARVSQPMPLGRGQGQGFRNHTHTPRARVRRHSEDIFLKEFWNSGWVKTAGEPPDANEKKGRPNREGEGRTAGEPPDANKDKKMRKIWER